MLAASIVKIVNINEKLNPVPRKAEDEIAD